MMTHSSATESCLPNSRTSRPQFDSDSHCSDRLVISGLSARHLRHRLMRNPAWRAVSAGERRSGWRLDGGFEALQRREVQQDRHRHRIEWDQDQRKRRDQRVGVVRCKGLERSWGGKEPRGHRHDKVEDTDDIPAQCRQARPTIAPIEQIADDGRSGRWRRRPSRLGSRIRPA
jgi:hypothetical protein